MPQYPQSKYVAVFMKSSTKALLRQDGGLGSGTAYESPRPVLGPALSGSAGLPRSRGHARPWLGHLTRGSACELSGSLRVRALSGP